MRGEQLDRKKRLLQAAVEGARWIGSFGNIARARSYVAHGKFLGRPIALIQAQPRSKTKDTHTADKVKAALIDKLKVPAESIRIATGDNDELGDGDLSKPECPVNYVVTVDKLR